MTKHLKFVIKISDTGRCCIKVMWYALLIWYRFPQTSPTLITCCRWKYMNIDWLSLRRMSTVDSSIASQPSPAISLTSIHKILSCCLQNNKSQYCTTSFYQFHIIYNGQMTIFKQNNKVRMIFLVLIVVWDEYII